MPRVSSYITPNLGEDNAVCDLSLVQIQKGFTFESDTDTETIAKLVKHIYYKNPSLSFREIVENAIQQLVGSVNASQQLVGSVNAIQPLVGSVNAIEQLVGPVNAIQRLICSCCICIMVNSISCHDCCAVELA